MQRMVNLREATSFHMKRVFGRIRMILHLLLMPLLYIRHRLHPLASYAQHQEDAVLLDLFGSIEKFIDIGANNGIDLSNTFLFALNGAHGLCFEPIRSAYVYLRMLYLFNRRVVCTNKGVSNTTGQREIRVDGAISTIIDTEDPINREILKDFFNPNARTSRIHVQPLSNVIRKRLFFGKTDVISIDVEGHELGVIQGIDFSIVETKCFVIETVGGKSRDFTLIDSILTKAGYHAALANKLNTFWIKKEYLDACKIRQIVQSHEGYKWIGIAETEQ